MRTIKIIIIFILSIGSVMATEANWNDLKLRWFSAEKIQFTKYVNFNEPIRSPSGATIVLAELILLNDNFSYEKDCLIYTVPSTKRNGELKVVNIKYEKKCSDFLLSKISLYQFNKIRNLALKFEKRKLTIHQDINQHVFDFFNLKINTDKKLLDSSVSMTKIPGVRVSFVKSNSNASLKDGELCFNTDDKCNILKDECFRCAGGIYPVVGASCRTKVRRYCGNIECGTRGKPACIRGFAASKYTGPYCINDSPVGYCVKPLRVMCINKELICR